MVETLGSLWALAVYEEIIGGKNSASSRQTVNNFDGHLLPCSFSFVSAIPDISSPHAQFMKNLTVFVDFGIVWADVWLFC